MKAIELRIENKLIRYNGNIATVTWGVIKDIEQGGKTYHPIALTEEWILKLGFKRFGHYGIYNKEGQWNYSIQKTMEEQKENGYWFFIEVDVDSPPSVNIEYVHQLQNLYFALTGEELTVMK